MLNPLFHLTLLCRFCYAVNMKLLGIVLFALAAASCAEGSVSAEKTQRYRVSTERETAYYLGTDAQEVEDTCPENNIMTQYRCTRKQADGYTCFDVYMAQGSPANTQRYSLLQERIERQSVTPQPQCPAMEPTCDAFLQALNYNLEFSWYLVNFPTSSFPQCQETYDCKRIDCYLPPDSQKGEKDSTLVSCVFKRNQVFFVGAQITCRQTPR